MSHMAPHTLQLVPSYWDGFDMQSQGDLNGDLFLQSTVKQDPSWSEFLIDSLAAVHECCLYGVAIG